MVVLLHNLDENAFCCEIWHCLDLMMKFCGQLSLFDQLYFGTGRWFELICNFDF